MKTKLNYVSTFLGEYQLGHGKVLVPKKGRRARVPVRTPGDCGRQVPQRYQGRRPSKNWRIADKLGRGISEPQKIALIVF